MTIKLSIWPLDKINRVDNKRTIESKRNEIRFGVVLWAFVAKSCIAEARFLSHLTDISNLSIRDNKSYESIYGLMITSVCMIH